MLNNKQTEKKQLSLPRSVQCDLMMQKERGNQNLMVYVLMFLLFFKIDFIGVTLVNEII